MTSTKKLCIVLLLLLLLLPIVSVSASSASLGVYYRPAMTVLVENAPEGLILRMDIPRNGETVPVYLYREDRLWESYFRLFRQTGPSNTFWIGNSPADFQNAKLVAMMPDSESCYSETEIPLSDDDISKLTMNDFFMLNMKTNDLSFGLPLWRTILLFTIRVLITTTVALIMLGIFRFRWKKSWFVVLFANLICQSGISLFLSNLINYNPKLVFELIFLFFPVLIIQIFVFFRFLREVPAQKRLNYTFWSNVGTALFNLLFMIQFPC